MPIRRALLADAERISALLTELAEKYIVRDFTPRGREVLLSGFRSAAVRERLASADYRFWVAEDAADLAGVVAMRQGSHLYYLFVAESWQRRGLARRLWDVARADALEAQVAPNRFTVNASRYAIPAYERLGFRCAGPPTDIQGVVSQPMVWVPG